MSLYCLVKCSIRTLVMTWGNAPNFISRFGGIEAPVSVCLSVCVGIRAVAECMVKSSSEQTCEVARRLLYCLAVANPRFTLSVYKGLVALFSCDLPIVQRMAAMTVRRLQVYTHAHICPVWGRGTLPFPPFPLSIYFVVFCFFNFSLFSLALPIFFLPFLPE